MINFQSALPYIATFLLIANVASGFLVYLFYHRYRRAVIYGEATQNTLHRLLESRAPSPDPLPLEDQ